MRPALCAVPLLLPLPFALAATHTVAIDGMQFQPAVVTVHPSDTVVWRNDDVVPHTVTAAGRFDSKNVAGGARWSWTARKKGRVDYVCTYHPGMKGQVLVE